MGIHRQAVPPPLEPGPRGSVKHDPPCGRSYQRELVLHEFRCIVGQRVYWINALPSTRRPAAAAASMNAGRAVLSVGETVGVYRSTDFGGNPLVASGVVASWDDDPSSRDAEPAMMSAFARSSHSRANWRHSFTLRRASLAVFKDTRYDTVSPLSLAHRAARRDSRAAQSCTSHRSRDRAAPRMRLGILS